MMISADLLPFVALTLVLGYIVPEHNRPHPIVMCITALLSISPIAYYIGMAVARYGKKKIFINNIYYQYNLRFIYIITNTIL